MKAPCNSGANEDRFRLAMASAGIGMAIVDLDGHWLEVNPAFERMFGYAAAELIGKPVHSISHPDEVGIVKKAVADMATGTRDTLDTRRRYFHRDGHLVWVHLNVAVMRDAHGQPAYFISQLRDISAQREAELALRELNETLEQRVAERTAEVETIRRQQELFAYGVSHDLRAPVRSVENFAARLAEQAGERLDETGRDYLERIRNAAAQMASLIDGLLELSRASRAELKPQPVDMSLLADWTAAELADADPGRAHAVEVQPGLVAFGDERQLKVLLVQLLHNAWKFSRTRERVEIRVSGRREGDRLHLEVRDAGIGFDMRYVDKLFEPFQRLHGQAQGSGNGLGLAIAWRIAERHRGRLWAQSEVERGSSFHLELPAVADLAGSEPA
ncbi:sensor histidine kinase [Luteimonas aquatica]|uniref:sensor histidine kinase n=1 Tax=Luteimonas aquatica TaxID=450364 RepID=UPI001F573931|nr:PAS domain S-box protein [Luteimonas aquatica]